MKKTLSLISLVLLAACGGETPQTTDAIIQSNDLDAIQTQKTLVINTINQLQNELEQLNAAIGLLDEQKNFLLVSAVELTPQAFVHFVEFQGNIETDQNIVLYPEIPGRLTQIYVKEGQRVKKGEALARLSDSGLVEQLEQLQLQLELAQTTFERQERLWAQKIGSEMQYLQAKTQYESIEKSVEQLEEQVAKATIVAPFAGVVDHLMTDVGSNVAPGMSPLIRLINLNNMKITAEVPEVHLPQIDTGAKVVVDIPVLASSIDASILSVGNYINPNNRSFRVEIALENKNQALKPNMTAKININDYSNPTAIVVADKNILEDQEGIPYVYKLVAEGDAFKAIKTPVKLGKSMDNHTEILDGLISGDAIVEEGLRLVENNQLVKIIQP